MNISIELVPRDIETLKVQLESVRQNCKNISTINIPDVARFDLRSWDACLLAKKYFSNTIPHIRAIDTDTQKADFFIDFFKKNAISKILIIQGDHDLCSPNEKTSIELIQYFKEKAPEIKVYAGIDPYRSSIKKEQIYIKKKIEAGADGFFTQPFFDFRLFSIYNELLENVDVYWGASPVVSEASAKYWQEKNHVIFPKNFTPTLEWSRQFLKSMIDEIVNKQKGSIYIMPIKVDIREYLNGVL